MDEIEQRIEKVCSSNLPYEMKIKGLVALEASIETQYASGLTQVKPISLMTPDDLLD